MIGPSGRSSLGDGIDARLCGNWNGKIEYLYMYFEKMTTKHQQPDRHDLTAMFNSHVIDQIVRVGINCKLD